MKVLCLCVVGWLVALQWPAHAAAELNADAWGRVLRAHVRAGRMDWDALAKDGTARKDLMLYLRAVATMREDEPLATWLNAYNALVVHAILGRMPVRRVRDLAGFFDTTRHRVAGQQRTLDEIAQGVIQDRFKDSRVHAAMFYASVSSPALPTQPFVQATLDAELTRLARALVASTDHVRVVDGRLAVSSLFFWFPDFARDAGTTRDWIKRYAAPSLRITSEMKLVEINFDWRLARAPKLPTAPAPATTPDASTPQEPAAVMPAPAIAPEVPAAVRSAPQRGLPRRAP